VIIDATNLRFAQRKLFYDLAESLGTKCQVISLTANEEVLLPRIKQRATRNDDPSDANADVLAWQQTQADPLDPSEPAVQCDTTNASLDTMLDALGMSD
jgi:predicted kinase